MPTVSPGFTLQRTSSLRNRSNISLSTVIFAPRYPPAGTDFTSATARALHAPQEDSCKTLRATRQADILVRLLSCRLNYTMYIIDRQVPCRAAQVSGWYSDSSGCAQCVPNSAGTCPGVGIPNSGPPLTSSRKNFLKDATDRFFREAIYT